MNTPTVKLPKAIDPPASTKASRSRPYDLNKIIAEARQVLGWPTRPPRIVDSPEMTDAERERIRVEEDRYEQNARCYFRLAERLRSDHAGRFICIANDELFVGDDVAEVRAAAIAKYTEQQESFFIVRVPNS